MNRTSRVVVAASIVAMLLFVVPSGILVWRHQRRVDAWNAAMTGRADELRAGLERGIDPNQTSPRLVQLDWRRTGQTLLFAAARSGSAPAVRVLLEHGSDPDRQDAEGRTPLSYAADLGHVAATQELLMAEASAILHDQAGMTPLAYALLHGRVEVSTLLLTDTITLDYAADHADQLLQCAVMSRNQDVVLLLLAQERINGNVKNRETIRTLAEDYFGPHAPVLRSLP